MQTIVDHGKNIFLQKYLIDIIQVLYNFSAPVVIPRSMVDHPICKFIDEMSWYVSKLEFHRQGGIS